MNLFLRNNITSEYEEKKLKGNPFPLSIDKGEETLNPRDTDNGMKID